MTDSLPTISAVIPTLNAERHLETCLSSIREQDYNGNVEILIADAGSTDRTLEIAEKYGVEKIVPNPLRTGEAGKAVGVKVANGDLILLIDSDNALIGTDWLTRMVRPFVEDPKVIGCEPARFARIEGDHFINRWHALLGAADPLTIYVGNYARESAVTGTWTGYPHKSETRDGWERIELNPDWVPVLGANGFMIRRSAYELQPVGDFLFDLDHIYDLVTTGHTTFARADVAVHHAFCDGVAKFHTKTRRRIDDFFFFASEGQRSYPWAKSRSRGILRFAVSTSLVVPVALQAARGQRQRPDLAAWIWHPVACWITLLTYVSGTIRGRLRPRVLDRENWKQ
ncbi:MAG: glycosyltransferase family 2 protein [Actinobacteria bacterium]|nr:glycosyltransferase family 2 protein [Actinomycetota bacterium]